MITINPYILISRMHLYYGSTQRPQLCWVLHSYRKEPIPALKGFQSIVCEVVCIWNLKSPQQNSMAIEERFSIKMPKMQPKSKDTADLGPDYNTPYTH